jgi:arsenate reductase
MAEGLFNALAPAGWQARSAGTDPQGKVRPEAIAAMREIGIDIAQHWPKAISDAMAPDVELVVGLCAEEACPVIPGVRMIHWPLPNPAGREVQFFRDTRDDLVARIRQLIHDLTGAKG